MRIAHIAPPWIPIPPKNYGGTENVLFHLIEEQISQGHMVTLFAPKDAQTSAQQISFFKRSLFDCGVPWQAHLKAYYHIHKSVDYLKKHLLDFDVVHTHLSSCSDMYVFPLLDPLPLPYITTLHSQFPFDRIEGEWQGDADHYYMEWLRKVPLVAISKHARRNESKKLPLNFIDVVHHGIDVQEFPHPQIPPENFFVWVGRIVAEKGVHLAIEAAKCANVPLVIAGIVDQNIPEAQAYFHQKIEPQLDGEQIRYIGPISQKERNTLFSKAKCMLNPLQWEEPFGMVMLEAMATGCPVIAFPRGAAQELILSEEIGFLVKNVAEMAKYISLVDTIDRNRVRNYVETHFSASIMAKKYTRVYEKAIMMKKHLLIPVSLDGMLKQKTNIQ